MKSFLLIFITGLWSLAIADSIVIEEIAPKPASILIDTGQVPAPTIDQNSDQYILNYLANNELKKLLQNHWAGQSNLNPEQSAVVDRAVNKCSLEVKDFIAKNFDKFYLNQINENRFRLIKKKTEIAKLIYEILDKEGIPSQQQSKFKIDLIKRNQESILKDRNLTDIFKDLNLMLEEKLVKELELDEAKQNFLSSISFNLDEDALFLSTYKVKESSKKLSDDYRKFLSETLKNKSSAPSGKEIEDQKKKLEGIESKLKEAEEKQKIIEQLKRYDDYKKLKEESDKDAFLRVEAERLKMNYPEEEEERSKMKTKVHENIESFRDTHKELREGDLEKKENELKSEITALKEDLDKSRSEITSLAKKSNTSEELIKNLGQQIDSMIGIQSDIATNNSLMTQISLKSEDGGEKANLTDKEIKSRIDDFITNKSNWCKKLGINFDNLKKACQGQSHFEILDQINDGNINKLLDAIANTLPEEERKQLKYSPIVESNESPATPAAGPPDVPLEKPADEETEPVADKKNDREEETTEENSGIELICVEGCQFVAEEECGGEYKDNKEKENKKKKDKTDNVTLKVIFNKTITEAGNENFHAKFLNWDCDPESLDCQYVDKIQEKEFVIGDEEMEVTATYKKDGQSNSASCTIMPNKDLDDFDDEDDPFLREQAQNRRRPIPPQGMHNTMQPPMRPSLRLSTTIRAGFN